MTYDYIILGAGASGLMLAYRMASDPFFDNKSILILDRESHKGDDRTWCYWEKGDGEWDDILHKKWNDIFFGSSFFSKTIDINPFEYKMIRSSEFYKKLWNYINQKPNITFRQATIQSFEEHLDSVVVKTEDFELSAKQVFNSVILKADYKKQTEFPVLQQHFIGWFIKTKADCFDDAVATFMDFDILQKKNTRFMYILPVTKREALFEYTLFSKDLLEPIEYEEAIKDYLSQLGIKEYEITEKERGSIPMTCFKFDQFNTKRVLNIGTVGGWTKASTGYTFRNTTQKTKDLINFLKTESDLKKFSHRGKFWFYDLLMLDVLAKDNKFGARLFSSLFKRSKVQRIFKFLDEETNVLEDISVMASVPPYRFIKALLNRIF